jgi:hypothetical protein
LPPKGQIDGDQQKQRLNPRVLVGIPLKEEAVKIAYLSEIVL